MVDFPNSLRDIDDGTSAPSGMRLTAEDTGTQGIDVIVVEGECFGRHIEWFDETPMHVVVTTDAETGGPKLLFSYKESRTDMVHEKRGFEESNNTWWRYPSEIDPNSYREHCLRIVRKA
jgi:hypothetical protein